MVVDNENNDEVKEEENVESFTEKEDVQEAINLSGITNFSFLALEVEAMLRFSSHFVCMF